MHTATELNSNQQRCPALKHLLYATCTMTTEPWKTLHLCLTCNMLKKMKIWWIEFISVSICSWPWSVHPWSFRLFWFLIFSSRFTSKTYINTDMKSLEVAFWYEYISFVSVLLQMFFILMFTRSILVTTVIVKETRITEESRLQLDGFVSVTNDPAF